MLLTGLLYSTVFAGKVQTNPKCKLDRKVKFLMATMKEETVRAVVDCVVDDEVPCDKTGSMIKAAAPSIICTPGCLKRKCDCDEIQVRVLAKRMRNQFSDQWKRVQKEIRPKCRHYASSSLKKGELKNILKSVTN
jgi:hypothetical protein